ncbi:hypothetical protein H0H81_009349 [Sphagnurus paluster]|uniref:SET domain-containing protein n=1 Tax=Sphagnurus paluster TaxID=117069 RepID=A0A9P7K2V2_9AGAR|nr:hypothetical protein H0H81_009349 [Sphagnurus paluster]
MKRGFLNKPPTRGLVDPPTQTEDLPVIEFNGIPIHVAQIGQPLVRLAIGKVNIPLPENYEARKPFYRTVEWDETGFADKEIYMTTLPPRKSGETLADNPDNWTQCLFNFAEQKRSILSTPGFPSRMVRPPEVRHRVGPSSFGTGVFATCDIQMGQLILSERPLLLSPVCIPVQEPNLPKGATVTSDQFVLAQMNDYEELLKDCVDHMEPENREAFFKLHNSHTEDGSGPIFGRIRTNGIGIMSKTSAEQKAAGNYGCTGVFNVASYLNHSCTPNVTQTFSRKTLSMQVRALRNIKKDEELFMSYCDVGDPTAVRQKQLQSYGFQCTCRVCSDPTTDALLEGIRDNTLLDERDSRRRVKSMIAHAEKWLAQIEAVGWQQLKEYGSYLSMATIATMGKDSAKHLHYQAKQEAWTEAMYGEPVKMRFFIPGLSSPSDLKSLLDALPRK